MSVVLDIQPSEDYEPSDNEIIEYGKWLGMTFPEDLPFLWIAREGLKAPLPEHWKACKSEKGELYYFNFKTGESIWDHPLDEHYKELFRREKVNPTPQSVLNGAKRQQTKLERKKSSNLEKVVSERQKHVKCSREEIKFNNATLDNKNEGKAMNNFSKRTNLQVKNNNTILNEVIVKREVPHELRLDVVNTTSPKVKLSSHISKECNLSHLRTNKQNSQNKVPESNNSKNLSSKQSQNCQSASSKDVNNRSSNNDCRCEINGEQINDEHHSTYNNESGAITVGGVQCLKRLSKRSLSNEVESETQSTEKHKLYSQEPEVVEETCQNVKMSGERISEDNEEHAEEQQRALLSKLMEQETEKFVKTFMEEKEETFATCFANLSQELKIMCDSLNREALEMNSLIKEQLAEVKLTSTIKEREKVKQVLDDTMKEAAKLIKEKEECLENALYASDVELQRYTKNWQEQCESARKTMTSSTEEFFQDYTRQLELFLQRHTETTKVFCNRAEKSILEEQCQHKSFHHTTCEVEDSPVTKCCYYRDEDENNYQQQEENSQNLCSRDAESLMCRVEYDCKESPSSSMGNTATTTATSRMATRLTTTTTASSVTTTRDSVENECSINFNSCESCNNCKEQKVIESEQHCAYCTHIPKMWEQTESQINGNVSFANNNTLENKLLKIEKSPNYEYYRHNSNVTKTRAHSMPPKLDADILECQANNRKFDIFSADSDSEQHIKKLYEEFLKETLRHLPEALKVITSSPIASISPCYTTSEQIVDKAPMYEHETTKRSERVNAEDNNDDEKICTPSVYNFCSSKDTSEEERKESRHTKKVGTVNANGFTTTESTPLSSIASQSESNQEAKFMKELEEQFRAIKLTNGSSNEVKEKQEKDLVDQNSVVNHKTKIAGGKEEILSYNLPSEIFNDIIGNNDDLDNQYSTLTECQGSNDVLFLENITREKWKRLQYRREQLHFAKRIWKLDMIEAKRCDVRSTSKRGQELKARQVKIENEMEGINHNEEILSKILNELATMHKENEIPETRAKITYNNDDKERFANEVFTNKEIKQMKNEQEREEYSYNQYSAAATKANRVKECVNICNYKNDVHSKNSKNNNKIVKLSMSEKEDLSYKDKNNNTEVKELVKLMKILKDSKFAKGSEGKE